MYRSALVAVLVPSAVLTRTWIVPAAWAGVTAVIWVGESTVNDAAAVAPKLTQWTPLKLVPLMITVWPPAVGPPVGLTAVIVGGWGEGALGEGALGEGALGEGALVEQPTAASAKTSTAAQSGLNARCIGSPVCIASLSGLPRQTASARLGQGPEGELASLAARPRGRIGARLASIT